MTKLVWDEVGERFYKTGIDRGVLYLNDGRVAAWNGLTSIEEDTPSESKSFYLDGVKFLENLAPGDFQGKLKAFTYPEEFNSVLGIADVAPSPGLSYHDQPEKSFNLSYRTMIGSDLGPEHGYEIHILYNIFANPDSFTYESIKESDVSPVEFGWTLTGTPQKVSRLRPTVHVTINSTDAPPDILTLIENTLYGTETVNPSLPSMQDLGEYFGYLGALVIIDHGDGTWTAIDESDSYITMLDGTTFQIANADATYLDSVTYTISSTNVNN